MNTKENHYDLIVIGSGPAGEKGAARAAYEGKRVALIEAARHAGGTAAGSGVPAKVLRETALHLSGFQRSALFGVDLDRRANLDVSTFMYRERRVRDAVRRGVAANLERHGITRFRGTAAFADEHTLRVRAAAGEPERRLTGDVILIATGSRPFIPPAFRGLPGVYDAASILGLNRLPGHLTVIGGGIVGCEFACLFAALGIEVDLIHSGERFFPFADREISAALEKSMRAMGMRVHIFSRVKSVERNADPSVERNADPSVERNADPAVERNATLRVVLETGDRLHTDAVLLAVGRLSNTENLRLERAGLRTGPRGLIEVDEHFRTAVPHIYAAGDVIGFPGLSSTAMEQGRQAVTHAFRFAYRNIAPGKEIPFGIWTIPEISMVGETEDSLRRRNLSYVDGPTIVGRARYADNPRGMVLGDEFGLLKLIFAPGDLRLLGVHIVGQDACELIATGLTALEMKMTAFDFVNLNFNFPSLADMYKYAAYDAIREYRRRRGEATRIPEAAAQGKGNT